MTFMVCPICRGKVTGTGVDDLSQALEDHLSSEHRMTYFSRLDRSDLERRPVFNVHDGNPVGTALVPRGSDEPLLVNDRSEITDLEVRCPFCGESVFGESENDLGEQMVIHWSGAHNLRPTILPGISPGLGLKGKRLGTGQY